MLPTSKFRVCQYFHLLNVLYGYGCYCVNWLYLDCSGGGVCSTLYWYCTRLLTYGDSALSPMRLPGFFVFLCCHKTLAGISWFGGNDFDRENKVVMSSSYSVFETFVDAVYLVAIGSAGPWVVVVVVTSELGLPCKFVIANSWSEFIRNTVALVNVCVCVLFFYCVKGYLSAAEVFEKFPIAIYSNSLSTALSSYPSCCSTCLEYPLCCWLPCIPNLLCSCLNCLIYHLILGCKMSPEIFECLYFCRKCNTFSVCELIFPCGHN